MSQIGENIDSQVPYLLISGTPEEMGRVHGETFAPLIQKLYHDRLNLLLESRGGISINEIKRIASGLWKSICRSCGIIAREVAETAKAAGLHPWQIVIAGGFTDMLDLLLPEHRGEHHECTIAIDPRSKYIAGTWDSHKSAMNSLIILERRPLNAPATLALTTAGWPCQQGVNSAGLGFAITNLTPTASDLSGIPYIAANALLGYGESVLDVTHRLASQKYCSGHSYIVVDSAGNGAVVETTSTDIRISQITELTTKANHYDSGSDAIDNNAGYSFLANSKDRALDLFDNIAGISDPYEFAKCLGRCDRVNRRDATATAVTCAHFFISVEEKAIWYSKGPALEVCDTQRLSVRRLERDLIL